MVKNTSEVPKEPARSSNGGWTIPACTGIKRPFAETETLHPHRLKVLLQLLAWLSAGLSLYLAMALLEVHWNLVSWKPLLDWTSLLPLLMVTGTLLGFIRLSQAESRPLIRVFSSLICLALLGLGIHLLPQEPLTEGLFARTAPSPAWYRFGRLLIMASPAALRLYFFVWPKPSPRF